MSFVPHVLHSCFVRCEVVAAGEGRREGRGGERGGGEGGRDGGWEGICLAHSRKLFHPDVGEVKPCDVGKVAIPE